MTRNRLGRGQFACESSACNAYLTDIGYNRVLLVWLAPWLYPNMLITTGIGTFGSLPGVTAEADHELACLPQLFPTVWWPLR